jgi:hypothetical protein
MKLEFSRLIFEKSSYIKFLEILSSDSRVVPHGKTGQTAFRNFANGPKNELPMAIWIGPH